MAAENKIKTATRSRLYPGTNPPPLIQTATARETKEAEARLTFAVGVIVPQRAEAILARAAASRLQVDTVGVLHAAVAL